MKRLLIVLFLLSNFCVAAEWIELMPKWYIDKETYDYNYQYDTAYAWFKILNNGGIKPIGDRKVWYVINKEEADCESRKIRMLKTYAYDLKSKVVISSQEPDKWKEVIPGSNMELIYKVLCRPYEEKDFD